MMELPTKADVLVVGLGPAGLSAAATLARGGAKVLAVDRSLSPGGKACAGGLTSRACDALGWSPQLSAASRAVRFGDLEVRSAGRSFTLAGPMAEVVTVDRQALAAVQLAELRDLGVSVRLGCPSSAALCAIAGFVVGCDGAGSRIRHSLGLSRAVGIAALQVRVGEAAARAAQVPLDRPVVWFSPSLWGSGYAWSFPAAGEVRIGCGVPLGRRSGLRARFSDFLGTVGLCLDSGRLEAGLVGSRYSGHRFGKVFLAGDAAGLASPLTGEGIYQAVVSGAEVAREILESGYRSSLIPKLATVHRRTVDALEDGGAAAWLYPFAPLLLRFGPLRRLTLRKYVR